MSFPRYFKPAVLVTLGGHVIASLGLPLVHGLHVAFRVKRTIASSPDSAEVALTGLDPDRVASVRSVFASTGRTKLTIASGYDGATVPLFAGDVRRMDETGTTDRTLIVSADDAGDALANATVQASTAGWTPQNMIDVALAAFARADPGFPIIPDQSVATTIASANPVAVTAFYASVSVGNAKDLLDEAARLLQCRWWIRDGRLFMARRNLPTDGLAIALPETHWLDPPADDGSGLIRGATFCDPNLVPGRQIALIREDVRGIVYARAESTMHSGDMESSEPWSCAYEARRILT